jgi:hypothetical protein
MAVLYRLQSELLRFRTAALCHLSSLYNATDAPLAKEAANIVLDHTPVSQFPATISASNGEAHSFEGTDLKGGATVENPQRKPVALPKKGKLL